MLDFNVKEFLIKQLNNGTQYFSIEEGVRCGCIKGISFLCCPSAKPDLTISYGNEGLLDSGNVAAYQWGKGIYSWYSRFGKALDIAEYILLRGYPQKAKLYLAHVVENYNVLERNLEFVPSYKCL